MNRFLSAGSARLLVASLFLKVVLLTWTVNAMAQEDLILCSPVKGRLLDNGVPVEGATIRRTISWSKYPESRVDTTITDAQGNYTFDEVRERYTFSWLDGIFHQPSVMVSIDWVTEGQISMLMVTGRSDYQPGSETGYPVIELASDISTQTETDVDGLFNVESVLRNKSKGVPHD